MPASENPPSTAVQVRIPGNIPLPPAEGANFFHFTFVGDEVQMLVGTINLLRVHEIKSQGESPVVVPDITHRFLLSPLGLSALKRQMDDIIEKHLALKSGPSTEGHKRP